MNDKEYTESLNEENIKSIGYLTDQQIIEKLWQGNHEAWGFIYLNSVIPVLRRKNNFQILRDRKIQKIEVLSMLIENMCNNKKLSLFQFRCPLVYWMRYYVVNVLMKYCKKNDFPVSSDKYEALTISKEASIEMSSDELEFAQKCFLTLWRKNPMRAYVHLLKVKHELSIREIRNLLDISSEKNTAKIAERALADMIVLRKELENSGGTL